MGPRVYTAREAATLIPQVNRIFDELDRIRTRTRVVKSKSDVLEMLWAEAIQSESNPDHREYTHYAEEMERLRKDFDSATRKIADLEGMLKSVDQGLVDFYGVIDSRLVFLCWKRGESSIEFYHPLEEGFSGRQPIPAEELAR